MLQRTRIIAARHATTNLNEKGIRQGWAQGILSKRGIKEANKLAKRLKKEKIDVIYSSDLKRAKQTSLIINKYHHLPIHYEGELRERTYGCFDGTPRPVVRKYLQKHQLSRYTYRPEGGESGINAKNRIVKFLNKIVKKHKGETILIISHGEILDYLFNYIQEKPFEHKKVDPSASFGIIDVINGKPVVRCRAYVKHL